MRLRIPMLMMMAMMMMIILIIMITPRIMTTMKMM